MSKPEMLDLVNENDEVIDTLPRDEIYDKGLEFVRVVEGFICNDRGELWLPVRGMHKRIAPGGFDIGVGGHVEHGETYLEAFRKETSEEVGWDIDMLKYREVGKFGPKDGLNTVSMVYEIKTNNSPELNPEDFTDAKWITPQDLADQIVAGHPAKMNLLLLLKLVYGVKEQ